MSGGNESHLHAGNLLEVRTIWEQKVGEGNHTGESALISFGSSVWTHLLETTDEGVLEEEHPLRPGGWPHSQTVGFCFTHTDCEIPILASLRKPSPIKWGHHLHLMGL